MYSPKIKENQIKELFKLKETSKIPMTKLVEQAIDEFLKKNKKKILNNANAKNRCPYSK